MGFPSGCAPALSRPTKSAQPEDCTAVEAGHRLRGLAHVLYGEGLRCGPNEIEKFSFLGVSPRPAGVPC